MSYQSERLFELMDEYNKANPDTIKGIIAKVQSVFHFEVSLKKGGDTKVFTVDLKNGNGKISKGKEGTPDATFVMLDSDVLAMAQGTLNPQQAFLQGKLKIKGNMAAAMKFTPDLLPKMPKI